MLLVGKSGLGEQTGVDLDDTRADCGTDETHLLSTDGVVEQLDAGCVEHAHPERREQLVSYPALQVAKPDSVGDGTKGGGGGSPNLANASVEVPGAGPGGAGIAGDLIQAGIVQSGFDVRSEAGEEFTSDALRPERQGHDILRGGTEKGVTGKRTEMSEHRTGGRVGRPEVTQDTKEQQASI